mmetsp:Transcript_8442/g.16580  ORF Transcript_8442/g.16580 Transcript_8442/m.16580 type:complete len:458 (-) Transcript_8442:147-1520(-)
MSEATGVQYDLTQVLAPYMDRHMVLRLIEFLEEKKMYPSADLLHSKLAVIDKTKMADLKINLHEKAFQLADKDGVKGAKERFEEAKKKCNEEKATVPKQYKKFSQMADPLMENFMDSELAGGVDSEKLDEFKKKHMIDEESIRTLYTYARFAFDIGQYHKSLEALEIYRILTEDEETSYLALWGKIAAEILLLDPESKDADGHLQEIIDDVNILREATDSRTKVPELQQLVQRAWLVNWSLFAYLATPEHAAQFVKFALQDRVINAVQIRCPYILRYIIAAVMISYDQNKVHLKQVIDLIEMERDHYRDPFTEFVRMLLIDYDFEAAHKELVECEKAFEVDFFLCKPALREKFLASSRHLMFELYCRTHKRIDISTLAKRLNLDEKDTDKALVDLIRSAPFEGKINSKKNLLVVATEYPSIYQKVIDKTKGLAHRTQQIADAINKKMQMKLNAADDP